MVLRLKKLSQPQRRIILQMRDNNLYLVTNEGSDFKCWLETEDLKRVRIPVGRRTGEALHKSGWIEIVNEELTRLRRFHYRLTKKAIDAVDKGE
ncbi:hypothetical protein CN449_15360 [Bacillus thuringiensis]|uniref:hypothetical protein n=1 Tax=Bacillus thuringiensis TaxID=1428 RepID=UPI000BF2E8BF|nr:hypothetical protein [Bacillus thuringiensis]PEW74041.1 hypothetical protein CN449_15360 [Bacillus thuringiensis]PFD32522.1 hypothetical protein CN269_04235 [Bacillus thuringiensis]